MHLGIAETTVQISVQIKNCDSKIAHSLQSGIISQSQCLSKCLQYDLLPFCAAAINFC